MKKQRDIEEREVERLKTNETKYAIVEREENTSSSEKIVPANMTNK